jgi:hypothetical protein
MLVYDRGILLETPAYFVALDFDGDRVVSIHDFLYARYATEGIDLAPLNSPEPREAPFSRICIIFASIFDSIARRR